MNIGEVRRMIVSLVRNTILGKTKSKIYNKQGIKWKKLGKQKISYRWTSDKMHDFGRRKLQEKRDRVRGPLKAHNSLHKSNKWMAV